MFKIGEFSKIAQTPASQLRYYDKIELFQPEHIDHFTGYRYYRATQLPDLNRILALKELGLTLEQIERLVADNVSPDEIRGMLSLKKAQIEQELHAQVNQLRRVEARLRQVEQDDLPDDIVIKEIPAQPIFSFREVLPDVRGAIQYRTEITRLLPQHIPSKKLGHFVAVLHEDAFIIENADVEMGFLLNDAVDETVQLSSGHELTMRILPHVPMAACVARIGGFENGYESYGKVGRWLSANGYRMDGHVRELFIVQAPPDRMDEMVCEIQLPIAFTEERTLPPVTNG